MSTGTPVIAVQNMPPEYMEKFNASRAYICNITDVDYNLTRTYGNYAIPARVAGEPYAIVEIGPRKGTMDMGDRRVFDFPITPKEVADDLCREINNDAGFHSFLGVFVCAGPLPTADELRKANARVEKFYQWCVAEGDKVWQQTRSVIMIPDLFKRAAEHLKLNRDWKTDIQPNLECEGCGTRHKPGLALCIACGAILDDAKARRLYPDRFAPQIDLATAASIAVPGSESTANAAHSSKGRKKS